MGQDFPMFKKKYSHKALSTSRNGYNVVSKKKEGYRSALVIYNEKKNNYYFESTIQNNEGYARIGVATRDAELFGPIGVDSKGYSYGNKNGYGFHCSKRIRMGERFFAEDIFSVLFTSKNGIQSIDFFINGNKVEKGFYNIDSGDYFPAVSLYGGCHVTLNFGPFFGYKEKIYAEMGIS